MQHENNRASLDFWYIRCFAQMLGPPSNIIHKIDSRQSCANAGQE